MKFIYGNKKININRKSFKDNDLKYLDLLEGYDLFLPVIRYIRRNSHLSSKGLDLDNPNYLKLLKKCDWQILFTWVLKLLNWYELPIRWFTTFLSIVLFSIPTPPQDGDPPTDIFIHTRYKDRNLLRIKIDTTLKEGIKIKKIKEETKATDALIANKLNKELGQPIHTDQSVADLRRRFNDWLRKHIMTNTAKHILMAIEIPVKDFST